MQITWGTVLLLLVVIATLLTFYSIGLFEGIGGLLVYP